jgi:hypothetical protein
MRCRSWVIITPPKRDDPIYASERFTVFLPQSGFVQRLISPVKIFGPVTTLSDVGVEYSTVPTTSLNPATNYAAITRS